ncbi:hypothetical protein ACTHSJ_05990 [Paenibacillus cellulositrophicus]|uniref:hypothetical protein n=1 Tax=Paenibacillus cellulositrophicus TaxID=562959 RepID=UPI003F7DE99E
MELADLVYALSLEVLRENVSPLDEGILRLKLFSGLLEKCRPGIGNSIGQRTAGQPDSLQDLFSFRGTCHFHGASTV